VKYFLCAFDAVYLGIQANRVERVISISVSATQAQGGSAGENDAHIHLPSLLGRGDLPAPHGIVLKPLSGKRKITLLAPPLDIDVEIPDESVFAVPHALKGFLRYLSGACFFKKDREERLVLILDLEKLTEEQT
jgi:chemotaxis signal transduction protein